MFRFTFKAFAQTKSWTSDCQSGDVALLQGFECIFKNILLIIVPLAGLAAFVVIIVAGFQYLTSAGDPKKLQQASGTLTAAIIGIVVVILIYFIFKLIEAVTGLNLLQFQVPK
ncbi:MAG: hypothetical protein V1810_00835 [Candidatus Beckwithbacteria bacterium]